MMESVDGIFLAVGLVVGGLLVRFLLPTLADAPPAPAPRVDGDPRHDRPLRRALAGVEREAPADGEDASEVGPYPRLAAAIAQIDTRLAALEHDHKLIRNEWADKESRLDSIIKRAWRLIKTAGGSPEPDEQPKPILSAAEQRAEIARRFTRGGA